MRKTKGLVLLITWFISAVVQNVVTQAALEKVTRWRRISYELNVGPVFPAAGRLLSMTTAEPGRGVAYLFIPLPILRQ